MKQAGVYCQLCCLSFLNKAGTKFATHRRIYTTGKLEIHGQSFTWIKV